MTVKLPKRVFKRWGELSAETHKAVIELLLSSRLDPPAAAAALSCALDRAIADFDASWADLPPGSDEPFAGEWDVVQVPEGAMLVGGRKTDDFERVIQSIVDDLIRQGVRGRLDLHQLPEPPSLPGAALSVVDGRVRVLGRRVNRRRARWAADRASLERVMRAATIWCLEVRPDRGVTLQHGAQPALLVRRCDSPYERLRDAVGDESWTTLRSVGHDRFRGVTVVPGEGRVTLTEGGPGVQRDWQPSVASMTSFLRTVSADAVYGWVRRAAVLHESEFAQPRATERLQHSPIEAVAYEEIHAPDVFPIQLLGPGYAGRVPSGSRWRAEGLPAGRVLVGHRDLEGWFGEPTLEQALRGESPPAHALLDEARADFAGALFTESAGEPQRRREWEMAHPYTRLPEELVAKVHSLPPRPYIGHWDVALVLRDGSVLEDVELGMGGSIVTQIGGDPEFELDADSIVDVLDR